MCSKDGSDENHACHICLDDNQYIMHEPHATSARNDVGEGELTVLRVYGTF